MKKIIQTLSVVAFWLMFSANASAATPLQYKINKTEIIDNQITVESGEVENVPFRIVTYKKGGDYVLNYVDTRKPLAETEENVKAFAKNMNAVVAINAGFWNYDDAERAGSWSKRELDLGKKGVLYSDGNDDFRAGVYGVTDKREIFNFIGQNGWYVGAFGAIVENGVIQTRWEEGDPNVKTARNMLVEFRNGTVKLIQNYGHSSTGNGLNHNEMVDLLRNFGIENIEIAFNLDGGGSTRMYTKSDSGIETITGAFVDQRTNSAFLGLVKKPKAEILRPAEKVESVSGSKNQGISKTEISAPNTGVSKNESPNLLILAPAGGALVIMFGAFRKRIGLI